MREVGVGSPDGSVGAFGKTGACKVENSSAAALSGTNSTSLIHPVILGRKIDDLLGEDLAYVNKTYVKMNINFEKDGDVYDLWQERLKLIKGGYSLAKPIILKLNSDESFSRPLTLKEVQSCKTVLEKLKREFPFCISIMYKRLDRVDGKKDTYKSVMTSASLPFI